jgi:hypothetical protein
LPKFKALQNQFCSFAMNNMLRLRAADFKGYLGETREISQYIRPSYDQAAGNL